MNDFELACKKHLEKAGYVVLRNGWPDFLVLSKDCTRGYALELKRGGDRLRPEQVRMHAALARFGILTHVLKDEAGLQSLKRGRVTFHEGDIQGIQRELREAEQKARQAVALVEKIKEQLHSADSLFSEPITEVKRVADAGSIVDLIGTHRALAKESTPLAVNDVLLKTTGEIEVQRLNLAIVEAVKAGDKSIEGQ